VAGVSQAPEGSGATGRALMDGLPSHDWPTARVTVTDRALGPNTVTRGWLPCLRVEGAPHLVLPDLRRDHVQAATRPVAIGSTGLPSRPPGPSPTPRLRPYRGQACLASPLAVRSTSKSPPRFEPGTRSVPLPSRGHSARWRHRPSWHDPEPPFHWCCQKCLEGPSPRQRALHQMRHPQRRPRRTRSQAIASHPLPPLNDAVLTPDRKYPCPEQTVTARTLLAPAAGRKWRGAVISVSGPPNYVFLAADACWPWTLPHRPHARGSVAHSPMAP
jgi:hypothetical protein